MGLKLLNLFQIIGIVFKFLIWTNFTFFARFVLFLNCCESTYGDFHDVLCFCVLLQDELGFVNFVDAYIKQSLNQEAFLSANKTLFSHFSKQIHESFDASNEFIWIYHAAILSVVFFGTWHITCVTLTYEMAYRSIWFSMENNAFKSFVCLGFKMFNALSTCLVVA